MSWAEQAEQHPHLRSLRCEDVVAGYGEVPILKGITITAHTGRVLAVVGPNGAGKSTLLRALLGLLHVRRGRILLGEREITNRPLEELSRAGVGYVPQVDDVFDSLRVVENLSMGGFVLSRAKQQERMAVVLDMFPALSKLMRRYAGSLSGGERKMMAIARVLMPDPDVLLLDEPTAGLSVELTQMVLETQVGLLATVGKAVLLVEQKAEAALKVADDAAVLIDGQVVLTGSGPEILKNQHVAEIFLGSNIGVIR